MYVGHPISLNVLRTLFFTKCPGVVFPRTLHLAREDNSWNRRQLRSMLCINLYTYFLICYNLATLWFHLLVKSLIIWCSEILSDLGYVELQDVSLSSRNRVSERMWLDNGWKAITTFFVPMMHIYILLRWFISWCDVGHACTTERLESLIDSYHKHWGF